MAPISFALASFSSLPEVTETSAPSARAKSMASVATPPPMPVTSTCSPLRSPPRETSARYAVTPATGNAAASSKPMESGSSTIIDAGTAIFSAMVPCRGMPRMRNSLPCTAGSGPHFSQGMITARLPRRPGSTPGPTDSTTPAPSDPSTQGSWMRA